ncbi:MAG TPA: GNAT family N-acetyltransferase [Gemmata sp.]|nr:GNAT family N-acetyltransferase [Gemmata sp.]
MWEHFPRIELPLTIEQFHRLPRNAAYKYEYIDGRAVLSARPKTFSCVRETEPFEPVDAYPVELLPVADIAGLELQFLAACRRTQPFESLGDDALACTRDCLRRVASGGDGPVVEPACFRALDPDHADGPVGAALVTLAHEDILTKPFAGEWKDAPCDAVARHMGCPHLTWIFVNPSLARRGVATALLAAVLRALQGMGYRLLASTFALDNGPSAMWHWRNGFRLLPHTSAFMREARNRRTS